MTAKEIAELSDLRMNSRDRFKSRSGLTIIEALVSLIILAGFMTGASKLILAHREMTDMARAHYIAANMAKDRLEHIRHFDFNERHTFVEDKVLINSSGNPDPVGKYRRTTVYTPVSGNTLELAVTVEIMNRETLDFDGRSQTVKSYYSE
ncbi:MAG TPA: hypothetical protein VIR63_06205 [Pontiella sp.]